MVRRRVEVGRGREVLPFVDIFLPNGAEAMAITGMKSPEKAMGSLRRGAGTIVVKRGAEGCIACNEKEALSCPAFVVDALDVTSAGDIFNAGFLHGFLDGWSLAEAMRFAAACGALSVCRPGSAGMVTGTRQVEQFLAEQGKEINVCALSTGGTS